MKTQISTTANLARSLSRTRGEMVHCAAKGILVSLIVAVGLCALSPCARAGERKGPTAGFGLGFIPYAGTGPAYTGVSYSAVSLSMSLGYAFTNQQAVVLFSELSPGRDDYQPVSFMGPVFSHYFSPNDRSGFLSIGIGRTFTSHHSAQTATFFAGSYNRFGPALYLGGGYMFRKHFQVSAGISIGSVAGVSKRYLSLTVSAIAF